MLLAVLGFALNACTSAAERAAKARDEGEALYAQGDHLGARVRFDTAISLRDDQPETWIARARNQVVLNDYAGALSSYSAALDLDRTNREALDAVGQIALLAGNYAEAARIADQILTLAPEDATGLFVRGSVQLQRGRIEASEATVKTALLAHPENENLLILQSRLLERRGKLSAAQQILEPLERASTASPLLLEQLTRLYEGQYDGRRLALVLSRAARAAPDNVAKRLAYARQLLSLGRVEDGLRVLDLGHADARGGVETISPIDVLASSDVSPVALTRAIAARPPLTLATVLACARYQLIQGAPDAARATLGQVQSAHRSNEWQALSAYVLARTNRNLEASKLAATSPASDTRATFGLLARALAATRSGHFAEALRDARLAGSDAPSDVEPTMVLVELFRARNDTAAADFTIVEGHNRNRDNVLFLKLLVEQRLAIESWSDLRPAVRSFTLRNPGNLAGWRLRRVVCLRMNDTSCAARAAAVAAKLAGRSVAIPPAPPEERQTGRVHVSR